MYRAYASGVGLPQRHDELHWQKFLKDSHHRRMREMKPAIDNKVKHSVEQKSLWKNWMLRVAGTSQVSTPASKFEKTTGPSYS